MDRPMDQLLLMACRTCAQPVPVEPDDLGRLPWEVRHDAANNGHTVVVVWPDVQVRTTVPRLPTHSFRQER